MLALELFENSEPVLIQALRDFLPIAVKTLKLDHVPKIHLVKELHDTHVPTFGRFENESRKVTVVVDNRNPVDIIRTLAHELVHYAQGERGELDADSWQTGSPEENQAHEQAGIMMREFDKKFPKYLSAEPVMLPEAWSQKYKKSINCSNPKGFSQKAHCAGRKARKAGRKTKSSSVSEGKRCDAKGAVPELKAALDKRKVELNKLSDKQVYSKIDKIMTRIANTYDLTGQELHDMWTDRYGEIPDTWILDEGKITNAALVAMLATALSSGPAQADFNYPQQKEPSAVAKALGIARKINSMKGYGPEAAKAEAQQELNNLIRALGNQGNNNSRIYPLIKDMVNNPGPLPTTAEELPQLIDEPTNENFADGKKPGRKGLAKRNGVNCKQSVTKLRNIAKNSTGEKRRMAHWCANMKSGRNK